MFKLSPKILVIFALFLSPMIAFGHMVTPRGEYRNPVYHNEKINAPDGQHYHKLNEDNTGWERIVSDPNAPTLDSCAYRTITDSLVELREYIFQKHSQWCSLGARYEGLCGNIMLCMEWANKCRSHPEPDLRCTKDRSVPSDRLRAAIFS